MTDEEIESYVGSVVVAKFIHGDEVTGQLVTDAPNPGCRYAIELPATALNQSVTWRGIPDASVIERIRRLDGLPGTLD